MADKKLIGIIIIGVLLIGGLYYFTNSNNFSTSGNVTITDMAGRNVQIPANVNKVMCFDSINRELCYLNSSDKAIGITSMEAKCVNDLPYLVANKNLANSTNYGSLDDGSVNFEKLIQEKPDVVFVDSMEKAKIVESKTGLPTVIVYTGMISTDAQYDNYTHSLQLMGKILHKEDRAKELTNYMDESIKDLKNRVKGVDNNKTVYIGGHAYFGDHGVSYTNPTYPPFNYLHLKNVASSFNNSSEATHRAIDVGKEQVISWNSDIIFIESSSILTNQTDSISNPEYQNLNAVKSGNVYEVFTYCMFCYNKEELLSNGYYIGKICYPEKFKDIDIKNKTNEIFEKFLGKPMYDEFSESSGYKYQQLNVTST